MADRRDRQKMDLDELLDDLARPQLPVETEYTKTLIQAKLAAIQNETARRSLWWSRIAISVSVVATLIALASLISG